ncbi:MAG TPA: hypothetical protein VH413_16125 [Verrucomicrobiae bacterium]|jgi:hypothetical protein|nr:hypothetical protein [Verrucomicrobiae bacterium]
MQKTNINPAIYQQFLESASNAGDKGQAQYFTPVPWAQALAIPLPRFRPVLLDLNCGSGHLLRGAARGSTNHLLGCDIDPCEDTSGAISLQRITGDLALLHPLARAIDFCADCIVLNPPWDLHLYRSRLKLLTTSELPAVRAAFANHDGRCGRDTIDSTVATLCIALDLLSRCGEGLLIGNESTLQRLILSPNAPHAALAEHIWAHLAIEGNICTSTSQNRPSALADPQSAFQTGVIYFARDHSSGLPPSSSPLLRSIPPAPLADLHSATLVCETLQRDRLQLRDGHEIKSYNHRVEITTSKWIAVRDEWERLYPTERTGNFIRYNLWLTANGLIATNVSLFDTASSRVLAEQANALFELNGKHPMELVIQRAHRRALEQAAFGNIWRVDPKLQSAVREAIEQYSICRAPLYELSPIQRLGYLDEQDHVLCEHTLRLTPGQNNSPAVFLADRQYKLRSATIQVQRSGTKTNLIGLLDDVQWNGQELAFFITDEHGVERVFMEGRLRDATVKLSLANQSDKPLRGDELATSGEPSDCPIDFTLQELVSHFLIPDVPDVARVNPEAYQNNLKLLDEIEQLTV